MAAYPIFLEIAGLPCLVIGGGEVAQAKAAALLRCGAKVNVVAPELSAGLTHLARQRKIRWIKRQFGALDLQGFKLAVAATDDQAVNEAAARQARRLGVWINVVDCPRLCTFILPSVVRRGGLVLAISTGGASPVLAKWIRKDLESRYGKEFGTLLRRMAGVRKSVQARVKTPIRRKALFEKAWKAYLKVMEG